MSGAAHTGAGAKGMRHYKEAGDWPAGCIPARELHAGEELVVKGSGPLLCWADLRPRVRPQNGEEAERARIGESRQVMEVRRRGQVAHQEAPYVQAHGRSISCKRRGGLARRGSECSKSSSAESDKPVLGQVLMI